MRFVTLGLALVLLLAAPASIAATVEFDVRLDILAFEFYDPVDGFSPLGEPKVVVEGPFGHLEGTCGGVQNEREGPCGDSFVLALTTLTPSFIVSFWDLDPGGQDAVDIFDGLGETAGISVEYGQRRWHAAEECGLVPFGFPCTVDEDGANLGTPRGALTIRIVD